MKQEIKKLFAMSNRPSAVSQRGFTLIEIAMVLVIVGLLLTMGLALFGTLTKRAKVIESREAVKQAKEAVLGSVVKNGFLPATLEAAGARRLDSWTRDIQYNQVNGLAPEIDASGENACSVDTTSLAVIECIDTACSAKNEKCNIGFIVYSKGEDANDYGTLNPPSGVTCPPASCPTATTCFYVREQASNYTVSSVTYEYDDIVAYVSLDEIRSLRGCPQKLVITSPNALDQGEEDSFYSYSLQAIGGAPPYTWGDGSAPTELTSRGLALNTSGLISGTLNFNSSSSTGELANCTETINIPASEFVVTDSAGGTYTSLNPFTISVRPKPLKIISETLPSGSEGSSYSATFFGTGGKCTGSGCSTSYKWTIDSGSLPPNLSLSTAGVISGTIATDSGCSTATYNFTVKLNDDLAGSGTGCSQPVYKGFSITVNDPDCAGGGSTTTTTTTTTTITTTTTTTSTTTTTTCPTLASYRVWNRSGYITRKDFWLDGICRSVRYNTEITQPGRTLNAGETLLEYSSSNGRCLGGPQGTLTYSQAACCDTDRDGGINYVSNGACSDR